MLDKESADDDEADEADGLTVVSVDTVLRSVTVVMVVNSVTVDSTEDETVEADEDEVDSEVETNDTATVAVCATATVVFSVTPGS